VRLLGFGRGVPLARGYRETNILDRASWFTIANGRCAPKSDRLTKSALDVSPFILHNYTMIANSPMALSRPVSPCLEMGAYEALWTEPKAGFKSIADKFRQHPGAVPSDFVPEAEARQFAEKVLKSFNRSGVKGFGLRIHGTGDYPERLRRAAHPVEVLYFRGHWELVDTPMIAIVGTRQPSVEGAREARELALALAKDGYTVTSGLAAGIDTAAHRSVIDAGYPTVAVIGTPISECYPRENRGLQDLIAREHLLISQVPVCRYASQGPHINRLFFPERNVTMSALCEATVIIEASDTSGTLIQARAALNQGKKLFIMDRCFNTPGLEWPEKYVKKGAIRIKGYTDLRSNLDAWFSTLPDTSE
jgi:DNA processing protein